ncbi:hypothetical protein NE865_11233 [Phthorimaea operculella]|nr:hypothetical protein NE865_11233 [Phthorimaea operculella]
MAYRPESPGKNFSSVKCFSTMNSSGEEMAGRDGDGPVAAAWNATSLDLADITMDRNFFLLVAALCSAVAWVVYMTYYNSRLLGFLLTRLINKFYFQDDNFKIGSITLNALSGKIMFRDIVYITYDYTLRIQDGYLIFRWWRSYIPKDVSEDLSHSDTRLSIVLNGFELHADVCSARVVFGNRLVPTTLSVSVEEAHLVYSTKPPASSLDHLMHFVKAKADNCKVLLAPSPNYTAMVDEPPRYMGEGFVVMSSNYVEVYFYMDEPGLVPERPVLLQLANGDVVESAPPIWGVDIKCGKGTDFSYGPWADRQRDHLFKFFFPPDYKNMEVTPQPKPGDRRQMQSFDIRLSTLNEATIDILFTKNKETNAVHINIGAGSYLEMTLPWIVLQDGYTTKITGQLLHLEATTSLQYRSFAESETLEFNVKCHYPLVWNHHQCWQLSLTGCKATAHFVYTHIEFFQDLVNDWASKARPDILHFVPYTWKISLLLKECEVVTVSNQYNWIDCSSTNQENNHVAFCGDLLDVSFDLPFIDFLPDTIPLKIWVQGEAVDMSLYLPEVNTSRLLLLSLDKNMKLVPCRFKASKWRRKCVKSQGWVDCWSVPIIALSVRYTYHPIPPLGPEPQADITTPEKEEILLSPMRIPRMRKQPQMNWANDGTKFDRTNLPPDKVSVELEVGPSILLAYGTIITSFMNLLENIFGEDQSFTDMQKTPNLDAYYWQGENGGKLGGGAPGVAQETSEGSTESDMFDTRRARPLDVTVSITLHDIQAHLVKNCSENEPPCPIVLIERFGFEMDKSFRETKLQLLLSPSILVSANNLSRTNPNNSGALYQGHLMLSSFQLRGHGFFSDAERSIEEDTIEYAWMMELQLGQLTGRLTLPQLYQIVSSLETFFLLVCDDENELSPPNPAKLCHHGLVDVQCPETDLTHKYRCPTPNEIKYRMIRVAVDLVDLYLADGNTALQTWVSPARLTFCNLHGAGASAGLAALLPAVRLALYTQTNMQATNNSQHHHSGSSVGSQNRINDNETWLGVGTLAFGPVLIEGNEALPQTPKNLHMVQHRFIKLHDEKTRRLWFLWPNTGKNGLCGCVGGCAFFGSNRNGPGFLKPCGTDLAEGVNVASFHVVEGAPGEFGYGQSLLHPGQLVFHTPPYGRHVRLHTPRPDPLSRTPRPPAPPSTNTANPHTARRASYTSAGKPAAAPARSEVPYARLVDSSALLGSGKIDSDSKLNKAVLCVPALESSVSDSRLALSCAVKDGRRSQAEDPFMPRTAPARAVAVSESHYSLDSQPPGDGGVPPEVRRTMSITSENQSEAFFSADEDMFPSRSSSLKHSFGSRHSNTRERSFGMNETSSERAWTAPVQKKAEQPDSISNLSAGGVQPDSESGSVSSTSFISAISSQEDMTLVNLHMQTNKPIVDSPLLMASYMHNLQQYRCTNWGSCSLPSGSDAFTLPLFRRADDGTLVYVGQRYLPNFEPIGKGNVLRLISKKESQNGSGHGSLPMPNFNSVVRAHPYPASCDSVVGVAVRLRGTVDVVLTPLVLESAQRFVESLTPVLANVHPATVLTHLRLLCISSVRGANVLKQKRYVLNWLPQMLAREGAGGAGAGAGAGDAACELATIPRTNAYEETVRSRVSVTLGVPRVDVLMLQSAVVEDTISFSALDNIQDLTCVSLFGVCVEGVSGELALRRRAVERVQLYYRPALRALASKKSFGIMKGARLLGGGARRPPDVGEPVYIESAQHQAEDIAFSLNIGKVHGQLRRIRNEACQLKDATITGIPSHYSKVSFTFARQEPPAEDTTNGQNGTTESQKENAIGYIMFECGLEGVGVKVSRHSQQKVGEERPAPPAPPASAAPPGTPKEPDSARASVRSEERDRRSRTSGFEDLFRKKESSSKPSTPNLGSAPPPPEPAAEAEAETEAASTAAVPATLTQPAGNTSSCSIDLKVVWFNFAAPPRTPITRKIDYTRLDWNLLSTAAPAINAWMNPCNRLGVRVVALYRAHARRLAATAACLMAGALDLAPHPHPAQTKSRYGRHTAMARQLREEPSLQLCGVLLRHALAADAAAVQADLADRHLPSLSTLRQGVIVLSRQWKNILYTPLLLEHGLRNKVLKPLNVTFALPELLEEAEWAAGVDGSGGVVGAATAAGGAGGSEPDAADENCLLLQSLQHTSEADEALGLGSDGSLCSGASGTGPSHAGALGGHATRTQRAREDLYQWMAKQEPVKPEPVARAPMIPLARLNPVAAAAALPACSLYPLQGSLMLLDAHLVFQPLLRASGVCPRQVHRGQSPPPPPLYPLQGSLLLLDAHLVFQPLLRASGVCPDRCTEGSLMLLDAHLVFQPLLRASGVCPRQVHRGQSPPPPTPVPAAGLAHAAGRAPRVPAAAARQRRLPRQVHRGQSPPTPPVPAAGLAHSAGRAPRVPAAAARQRRLPRQVHRGQSPPPPTPVPAAGLAHAAGRAPRVPAAAARQRRLPPTGAPRSVTPTPPPPLYPLQGSLMLLDAHLVFQPLLRASGVCPRQVHRGESNDGSGGGAPALESLGSRLALLCWVDTVRADIVVGELGRDARRAPHPRAQPDHPPPRTDTAAFICEKVSRLRPHTVRADIVVGELGRDARRAPHPRAQPDHPPPRTDTAAFICEKVSRLRPHTVRADIVVGELGRDARRAPHPRAQPDHPPPRTDTAAFICEKLKRHISTVLNFNLAVRHIEQQVNMPLLRLLHQISSMYQNVKDAQVELRGGTTVPTADPPPSSSVSDFRENLVSVSSMDGGTQYSTLDSKWELLGSVEEPPGTPTPTPSADSKLRSTGKSVKGKLGYSSLSEGAHTPMFPPPAPPPTLPPGGAGAGAGGADSLAPRCWRTLYLLLDLYAQMPDADTITHRFSVSTDLPEKCRGPRVTRSQSARENSAPNVVAPMGIVVVGVLGIDGPAGEVTRSQSARENSAPNVVAPMGIVVVGVARFSVSPDLPEKCRGPPVMRSQSARENSAPNVVAPMGIVVVGVARIHRTRLLASLSGLKLEAEITALQGSLSATRARQWSLTGTLARSTIVLLEGAAPHHATVVRVSVGKSQALHSWEEGRLGRAARGAAVLLSVGGVRVELPQHPVALHGVMTRSSRQLSSTLQELGVGRAPLLHSPQLQFSIAVQSLSITAALLPSLQAQYKMENVSSSGVTGDKAHFTIELPQHCLSFVTKLQASEANIPAAAMVALPAVHVCARVAEAGAGAGGVGVGPEGAVLRAGRYLAATADIGLFEHTLSTDLLNHLVFVQKVFMKEVNEVVQKVSGGEKPVPLWGEEAAPASPLARALFTLVIRIQRIQLTATTPSNSAVRLETGAVELELSNRVQNVPTAAADDVRLFARAQVDINLSLGQLIRNAMFEEAEPEFQQYAFFNTRISMRNAFQDEMPGTMPGSEGAKGADGAGAAGEGEAGDVVLIRLKRPLVYVQPVAVDRAILVWLNYKNAYEYWNEKRRSLNTEVLHATQQLIEKVQQQSQLAAPLVTTLFLQLDVDDIGICLPLTPPPLLGGGGGSGENEARGAVVVTLESTSVSACSRGALVSAGRFVGLCLRFADEFEASLDDWKPRGDEPALNVCCVSEGTYEVCSRTTAARHNENAKWFLNVSWQMEGVDIHLDVSVGKQLSALGHTLTMLTGFEEEEPERPRMEPDSDLDDEQDDSRGSQESLLIRRRGGGGPGSAGGGGGGSDNLPAFVFDPHLDARQRSKLIEQEMNEQAKIINDLRALGASHATIQHEMKRLHDLEALVFKDFRRDMIQKLRRQSVKASSITRGKLGLGSNRSKSFMTGDPPSAAPLSAPPALLPDHLLPDSRLPDIGELHVPTGPLLEFEESRASLWPRADAVLETRACGARAAAVLPDLGALPHSHDTRMLTALLLQLESQNMGPSRSASLRGASGGGAGSGGGGGGEVPRRPPPTIQRQSSLPAPREPWLDIDPEVELRRKYEYDISESEYRSPGGGGGGGSGGGTGASKGKAAEPNIDFELDVKVHVNSGKCVLHTSRDAPAQDDRMGMRVRVGRSASGGLDAAGTSTGVGGSAGAGGGGSPNARRKAPPTSRLLHAPDTTVFRVPGLHLKVHYESKTMSEDGTSPGGPTLGANLSSCSGMMRKGGAKKAALFAWITLQSIPEETIISPHILEFLESWSDCVVLCPIENGGVSADGAATEPTTEAAGAGSYQQYVYASFPVDVIVHFHMQPSTFRFSCLPASRVECLLQLPSLQIVFSSKRATDEELMSAGVAAGGLSVTGCLADFSVYMFHPYGGKKPAKDSPAPLSTPAPAPHLQWSPLQDQERKDSLSINVEFVKFHLSRSRKLDFHADADSKATVRFSTIVDVGSAWFKYDMRRLGEILAFPKAWYRRTIVRRMFLGDVSARPPPPHPHQPHKVPPPRQYHHTPSHGSSNAVPVSPNLPQRDKSKTDVTKCKDAQAAWETLVLFAVNFTKLNVHMNMGNVMGNVSWQSRDFTCSGRLSIGSTGHRNMLLGVTLASSALDARGGIVGGAISLCAIHTYGE